MRFASLGAIALAVAWVAACGSSDSSQPDFSNVGSDAGDEFSGSSSGSSSGASSSSGSGSSSGTASSSGSSSGAGGDAGASGSSSGSSGGNGCTTCTTDQDCQSSCPPVSGGGTNCCDTGSGVCYATTQSSCPTPSDGGGGPG